jgi:hypothetical protein
MHSHKDEIEFSERVRLKVNWKESRIGRSAMKKSPPEKSKGQLVEILFF